ncbi:YybH family protein [Fodinibius salsisoli]|uniref:SgcJ/EcaC family oxidoreductase n=1 Tax=Fodinibius salsisoli TaxID=2820877 RepID=A0ABT3PL33_9BACT|nr:SgcJ/EcaC family oxidoreductase [Fodinibius salsisoli]MCW9706642.1 SgcJ/EcaC family oxidoreductase [Fodinibius salsisoli]
MDIPDSLIKQHQNWINAVNNENIDEYANILAEDAVWIPPGQQPIIGRKAFRQWLKPFFGKFSYDFSISDERFLVSGNWAFERAKFTSKMTPNSGGDPMAHSGTFTVLWNQDDEDNWLINRYIDDSNINF